MKNLILPLTLVLGVLGFSQSKSLEDIEVRKETRVERVDVTVTVDSLEELESTFTLDDVREMFELSGDDKAVSFNLVCNGKPMSNGKKSNMSYKVEGSSGEETIFIKRVEAIKKAAIKYYQNK
jgi:hypothetical protein